MVSGQLCSMVEFIFVLTIVFGNYTILVFFGAIFVPPSVDGVKAVGEGGVGRLQLVDLLLAVPDLRRHY